MAADVTLLAAAAHTQGHDGPRAVATLLLVIFAVVAGYAFSALRWPWHTCPKCRGARVNTGSNGKRWGMCKRCGGAGRTQRPFAGAVHRFYWSVLGDRMLERRRKKHREAQEQAGYPEL
jgi:hypothetical protein